MSVNFNQGYRETLSSFKLNEKIDRIYGANGVIKGFDISSQDNGIVVLNLDEQTKETLDEGEAIVNGTLIKYYLVDGEAPMSIKNIQDGTWNVYGLYSVYKKTFSIHLANSINDAQGTWKVFLGHVVVSGGIITEVQPLVPTSDITKPVDYRRLTSLSNLARYVYDANSAVLEDIWKKVLVYVGDITFLKTTNKTNIVNAINELYQEIINITETIGDNLEIENFAKRRVDVNNNGINCFQMKQFVSPSTITGYIMIKLPVIAFNNESISLTIKGVSSSTGKGFLLTTSGVLSLANNRWENCSAYVLGDIPCSDVVFARNSSDGIYLLFGAQNLSWGYVNISLENILVTNNSNSGKNLWRDGWDIKTMNTAPSATSSTITSIKTGGPQDGDFVDPSRQIKAGVGLEGGGSLRNDVTISAKFGTGYNDVARGNHTHGDTLPNVFTGKTYRVIVTDGTGKVVPSEITTTELDCLDGIKSNIQKQLDGKSSNNHTHPYLPLTGGTVTGNLTVNGTTKVQAFQIGNRPIVISKTKPSNPTVGTILFQVNS